MSDIEKARQNLQISGYVHPETNISKSSKIYKSLDTETKGKNYSSSTKKTGYATFTEKTKSVADICPVCKEKARYACDCDKYDMQCDKGHIWFLENGNIKLGDPHENE